MTAEQPDLITAHKLPVKVPRKRKAPVVKPPEPVAENGFHSEPATQQTQPDVVTDLSRAFRAEQSSG
jgi:hypothetical protein